MPLFCRNLADISRIWAESCQRWPDFGHSWARRPEESGVCFLVDPVGSACLAQAHSVVPDTLHFTADSFPIWPRALRAPVSIETSARLQGDMRCNRTRHSRPPPVSSYAATVGGRGVSSLRCAAAPPGAESFAHETQEDSVPLHRTRPGNCCVALCLKCMIGRSASTETRPVARTCLRFCETWLEIGESISKGASPLNVHTLHGGRRRVSSLPDRRHPQLPPTHDR